MYFLISKKTGGFRPIFDLRGLDQYLKVLPFHMLTTSEILRAVTKYINRPQRCVVSCTYFSGTLPLSKVCLSGLPLAVLCAPIRPLPFPKGVHSVREGNPLSSAGLRHKGSAIPRRLASLRPVLRACIALYESPACSSVSIGPQGEFG